MKSIDFINELFDSFLNMGSSSQNKEIKEILENNSYKEILDKIIFFSENIDNSYIHYVLGTCYYLKGANFRKKAIEFYEKAIINPNFYNSDNFDQDLGILQRNLGTLYEKEYDFDKSLFYYELALKNLSDFPSAYINIADIYYKTDKIDEAISFIEKAKESPYYVSDPTNFKIVIERYLEIYKVKKKNGKKYKAKPIKKEL